MADDYIKRGDAFDAVMGQFCASSDETEEALNGAIEDIRKIPAADVVEVVRCRECKQSNYDEEYGKRWCCRMLFPFKVADDFFCADGARMDGDGE